MRRIFFLLVICMGSLGVYAQSGFFVKNNHIEKWYKEGENLEKEIKKVIILPEFQAVVKEYEVKVETLTSCFHFADINNNGELDILFDGKIIDQHYVFIFLKKGNNYLVVLEQKGTIIQANLPQEDNNLNISIWNGVCCGDHVNVLSQWVCISRNGSNYFENAAKSLVFRSTFMPSVRLEKPVKCTVINVTNLRTEPNVDEHSRIAGMNAWVGNSVGVYSLNATGTIYAEMKQDGKFWYFVRMNNEAGLSVRNNRFTHAKEVDDAQNCFYYGWISSDDVSFE